MPLANIFYAFLLLFGHLSCFVIVLCYSILSFLQQFWEKKGDLTQNENHQKNNGLITKLVYIHEGIEKDSPESKRHCLKNPYYFCGVSTGEENLRFWDEVYEYMENNYDLDKVKKIYVKSDGGS